MRNSFAYMTRGILHGGLILLLLGGTGCYRITYKNSTVKGQAHNTDRWVNFFLFGVAPSKERLDASDFCPNGALVEVRTSQKAPNVLSTIFGMGLTGAYTAEATCVVQSASLK